MAAVVEGVVMKRSGGKASHVTDAGGKLVARKKSMSKGSLMRKWDSRFFRLSADALAYWGSAAAAAGSEGAPKGSVAVAGAFLLEGPPDEPTQLTFVSIRDDDGGGSRDLDLKFSSAVDKMRWQDALASVGVVLQGDAATPRLQAINGRTQEAGRAAAARKIQAVVRGRRARQDEDVENLRAAVIKIQRNFRGRSMRHSIFALVQARRGCGARSVVAAAAKGVGLARAVVVAAAAKGGGGGRAASRHRWRARRTTRR